MIQTYQGQFLDDVSFFVEGKLVKLPTKKQIIINVLDDEAPNQENVYNIKPEHKRVTTIKKLLDEARKKENDTLTDDDWDEMANIRAKTNAGLSRGIEI